MGKMATVSHDTATAQNQILQRLDDVLNACKNDNTNLDNLQSILRDAVPEVVAAQSALDAITVTLDTAGAQNQTLQLEKQNILDGTGHGQQRSIQEQLRMQQIGAEMKSNKDRGKKSRQKMRKTQQFLHTIIDRLDAILSSSSAKRDAHSYLLCLISFCIDALAGMQSKFAAAERHHDTIYKTLLEKAQTKPLIQCLMRWIHCFTQQQHACARIVQLFMANKTRDRQQLWILSLMCCVFPALFIAECIDVLQGTAELPVLLHGLLPKFPVICLQIIDAYAAAHEVRKLQIVLKVCQFHPRLWRKIESQPFAVGMFKSLLTALNTHTSDDEKHETAPLMPLLFGLNRLMIDDENCQDALARNLDEFIAHFCVNLDDFSAYMNHSMNIKHNATVHDNGCAMLLSCDRMQTLKQCRLSALLRHPRLLRLLCLLDDAFFIQVVQQFITQQLFSSVDSNTSNFVAIFAFTVFRAKLQKNIDMILFSVLQQSQPRRYLSSLCFVLRKYKLKFVMNSALLAQLAPLFDTIDDDLLQFLSLLNFEALPRNNGVIVCSHLFLGLLRPASARTLSLPYKIVTAMLRFCECDGRIAKECIQLCVSFILRPELNGAKIDKLSGKPRVKSQPVKRLTPKIRLNPYANAVLQQIHAQRLDDRDLQLPQEFQNLQKIIDDRRMQFRKKEGSPTVTVGIDDGVDDESHESSKQKLNDETFTSYILCWYLLHNLSEYFVPYLSEFLQTILPGTHLQPSQARYLESIQKALVLMFDHNVLNVFESYPDLLLIIKCFCHKTAVVHAAHQSVSQAHHYAMLVYLRSLSVSYYIESTKYTKAMQANSSPSTHSKKGKRNEYNFYSACGLIFECMYLCGKTSLRFQKMTGLLFDLELNEVAMLLSHVCNLYVPKTMNPQFSSVHRPQFPTRCTEEILEAEKRVIREILLQNTKLMNRHVHFVASIFALTLKTN